MRIRCLVLIVLVLFPAVAAAQTYNGPMWKNEYEYKEFQNDMNTLGGIEHGAFFSLRVGGFAGVALHDENPFGVNGDAERMVRGGVQLSIGGYGLWPMDGYSIGLGALVSQQLGMGAYLGNNDGNVPFIGMTTLDFIFPIAFENDMFIEFLFGFGAAYSNGDAYTKREESGYSAPYIYDDNLDSGGALIAKIGFEIGGYFNEHIGLGVQLQYVYISENEERSGDTHVEHYGNTYYEVSEDSVSYRNSMHHILPTIELLIRY